MTYRAPRHPAMVDFQQHQERLYVVLEEDHEKVEKERDSTLTKLGQFIEEAMRVGVHLSDEPWARGLKALMEPHLIRVEAEKN